MVDDLESVLEASTLEAEQRKLRVEGGDLLVRCPQHLYRPHDLHYSEHGLLCLDQHISVVASHLLNPRQVVLSFGAKELGLVNIGDFVNHKVELFGLRGVCRFEKREKKS